MTYFKAKLAELKKGCGHLSLGKVKGLPIQVACGNRGFKDGVCLCEVCRAKIQQLKECEEEIRKVNNNIEFTNLLRANKCINVNDVMDKIKEMFLKELGISGEKNET